MDYFKQNAKTVLVKKICYMKRDKFVINAYNHLIYGSETCGLTDTPQQKCSSARSKTKRAIYDG